MLSIAIVVPLRLFPLTFNPHPRERREIGYGINFNTLNYFIMITYNGHVYTQGEIKGMRDWLSESIDITGMGDMDILLEFLSCY
jgi:hypothetical protein